MLLRFKKEQLIAALEARRPWARAYDKVRLKEHRAAEKATYKAWQQSLRDALKWSYERAEEEHFNVSLPKYDRYKRPRCPEGVEQNLDRALALVETDGRARYTLSNLPASRRNYSTNNLSDQDLYWLLTFDENAKADICE